MPTNTTYPNAANWTPLRAKTTNITLGNIAQKGTGFVAGLVGSLTGIPIVSQIGQSLTDSSTNYSIKSTYAVAALGAMKSTDNIGIKFPDFRARKFPKPGGEGSGGIATKRLDGTATSLRTISTPKLNGGGFQNSARSAAYAAGSILPFGAYTLFNVETTYGMGDHGNPYAFRNDFTAQSHVATQWRPGNVLENGTIKVDIPSIGGAPAFKADATAYKQNPGNWAPTRNLVAKATPFRGDKVNVIDFSQRKLKDAYRWLPKPKIFGVELPDFTKAGLTADFIKFFFTGPKLHAGNENDQDDIIVFRSTINSLSDSFNAAWNSEQLIGRGDPNYRYGGFTREMALDFTIYSTDRDEVKPIWRKLNALAGYTAPEYTKENLGLVGPWMRITIGDLLNQQPIVLKSINYNFAGDAPWEINIEKDPTMMQTPHKIDVSLTFTPVTDWLPQKGGRFYSLAKRHNGESGLPLPGNDDWLSDTRINGELSRDDLEKLFNKQKRKENIKNFFGIDKKDE